jgi:hypothetical protein
METKINTQDLKLIIIENFIDYFARNDEERDNMKTVMLDYINQDHVDEIGQAIGITPNIYDSQTYSDIEIKEFASTPNQKLL